MSTTTIPRDVGQLYQAPMVRAIIKRTKTNTRRELKPPKGYAWLDMNAGTMINAGGHKKHVSDLLGDRRHAQPGDTIWVRETYSPDFAGHYPHDRYWYAADDDRRHDIERRDGVRGIWSPESQVFVPFRWRPAIHMPRKAARLLLTCTAHRIERLQAITEADALAEGIERYAGPLRWVRYLDAMTGEAVHLTARDAYLALWDAINGDGSAALNPWVRSIYFTIKEPRHHG